MSGAFTLRRILIVIAIGIVLSTSTWLVTRESRPTTCATAETIRPARLQATGWPAIWWRDTCDRGEINDVGLLIDILFWSAVSAGVVFAVTYARHARPRPPAAG